MLLQKTIFDINVLTLVLQVDTQTQTKLREIEAQKPRPKNLDDKIAQAIYEASHLKATMHFLRDISLNRFTSEVRSNVACARKTGVITEAEKDRVDQGLALWFAPLRARGIKKGDDLVYIVTPGSLRTIFRSLSGKVLVDQTDSGNEPKLSLLGGYLAPCSEFRKPLIESLRRR